MCSVYLSHAKHVESTTSLALSWRHICFGASWQFYFILPLPGGRGEIPFPSSKHPHLVPELHTGRIEIE